MTSRHFCTGLIDSEAAEIVAKRHGIEAHDYEQLSEFVNDDDEFECEGCGGIVRLKAKAFWQSGGYYEPYDGSSYGSPSCASLMWQSKPGSVSDWLERLGWYMGNWAGEYFEAGPLVWIRRSGPDKGESFCHGPIIAREGGPSYRRDLARARKLAKEFRAVRREVKREKKNEG